MKGDVIFSDGVEKKITEWKCSLLENFQEEEEEEEVVPLQYEFNPKFFIEEIDSEVLANIKYEEIFSLIDFWNYMGCNERMYFFYLIIYKKMKSSLLSGLILEREMRKNLSPFKSKCYYKEMIIIIRTLNQIIFVGKKLYGRHQLLEILYTNLEVIIPFINFLDSTIYWTKFFWIPISFEVLDLFILASTQKTKIYREIAKEILDQTLLCTKIESYFTLENFALFDSKCIDTFRSFLNHRNLKNLHSSNPEFYDKIVNSDFELEVSLDELCVSGYIKVDTYESINYLSSIFKERFCLLVSEDKILHLSSEPHQRIIYDKETLTLKVSDDV